MFMVIVIQIHSHIRRHGASSGSHWNIYLIIHTFFLYFTHINIDVYSGDRVDVLYSKKKHLCMHEWHCSSDIVGKVGAPWKRTSKKSPPVKMRIGCCCETAPHEIWKSILLRGAVCHFNLTSVQGYSTLYFNAHTSQTAQLTPIILPELHSARSYYIRIAISDLTHPHRITVTVYSPSLILCLGLNAQLLMKHCALSVAF